MQERLEMNLSPSKHYKIHNSKYLPPSFKEGWGKQDLGSKDRRFNW